MRAALILAFVAAATSYQQNAMWAAEVNDDAPPLLGAPGTPAYPTQPDNPSVPSKPYVPNNPPTPPYKPPTPVYVPKKKPPTPRVPYKKPTPIYVPYKKPPTHYVPYKKPTTPTYVPNKKPYVPYKKPTIPAYVPYNRPPTPAYVPYKKPTPYVPNSPYVPNTPSSYVEPRVAMDESEMMWVVYMADEAIAQGNDAETIDVLLDTANEKYTADEGEMDQALAFLANDGEPNYKWWTSEYWENLLHPRKLQADEHQAPARRMLRALRDALDEVANEDEEREAFLGDILRRSSRFRDP
ncbi:Aste57867_21663 [Aphanomyces stellatus]|uniref:Aste57867_21663 protein n=1 Tax=Aphanomyces stellatus TaxID=120398 RepID=A0A485LMY1_9STRA|nr:hypothetical protein As57867_021594 [Aphanomyces stellatus]VFT98332.1 Aste57867_21663 [Aphanomyces stellatus]